ncbi:isoleucine--tRNA ligase, cytoplasmic-like [Culicoides brevitarsis]|uniref:isoleucine--tRNA ligase, cytoplasmic-like n=1 Tax=Culicoides brevitarsis TaxID=469753 RepID=UPI00307B7229
MDEAHLKRVPENINFAEEEEKIQEYWKKENAFENCLKQSKGKPRYTFYDGPPFATGLPHYGHILAGTIKDIVTRYAHQQGYHVERRFGWDCHGLPVEYEIDKTLGIKGPEDVAKMGITAYNNECRKIVMRYAKEWEEIISRMGRWIDFKNDYKTLYPSYMESIWWVFKQLYVKGLVYQGVKVMPYSTACTTALSNFESGQNYKEVVDPAVVVNFPIVGDKEGAAILAWTTTPWTLPSNLACCVNPALTYVRVKEKSSGKVYIVMESRIEYVFKSADNVEVLKKFPGKELVGLKYEPLFNYFAKYKETAFRVLQDGYVTEDSGTGVVHQAPYFGEDDYRVCLAHGVIKRDQEIVCPVDPSGKFSAEVPDFAGQYVKDADKNIIANLKKRDRVYSAAQTKHSYPFCWRSDTPLIYKAVPSWFVRVEHMNKQLLNCSSQTYWVPEYVKEKRFGNWLKEARDWAISRNRYWGTPIPLWISPNGEEIVCIGSIEELEQYSGVRVTDLHRENIDHIEIPSAVPGNPPLRRITEVFDCWFESGSMPYAQQHYPFDNPNEFLNNFPADFIAEGIDQTRGWFYTLLVISTALFNKPSFKNLIVNGLVLASDGQKMSKRKKNYPDPMDVVHKYGADALRLYLINSPVVRAENLRFKEEGVRDIVKDIFLPWYNAYRFLFQNIEQLETTQGKPYKYDSKRHTSLDVMDIWITSIKESLLDFIAKEMKAYRLYTVVPRLTKFIDLLTNWYVRLNRRRIKGELGVQQAYNSIDTLFDILLSTVKMMAPFTPFLTELMYQRLRLLDENSPAGSVHYQMMPNPNKQRINLDVERAVGRMQAVVELGRVMRDRRTVPIKYPLPELIVIQQNEEYHKDIKSLESFILSELNVRKLTFSSDKEKFGVKLKADLDYRALGSRLKNDLKAVKTSVQNMTDADIQASVKKGFFELAGHKIELEHVKVIYQMGDSQQQQKDQRFEANSDSEVLCLMDMQPSQELVDEGLARELINRVQKLKKKGGLFPTDPVVVFFDVKEKASDVAKVGKSYKEFIETAIKSQFLPYSDDAKTKQVLVEGTEDLKGVQVKIVVASTKERLLPYTKWFNLLLHKDMSRRFGAKTNKASLCLYDFNGKIATLEEVKLEVEKLFGLHMCEFVLTVDGKEVTAVTKALEEKTVFISRNLATAKDNTEGHSSTPYCKFVNVDVQGKKLTVFTENPVDSNQLSNDHLNALLKNRLKNVDVSKCVINFA